MDKIRIVAATVYKKSNEVEFIIERTTDLGTLDEHTTLLCVRECLGCEMETKRKNKVIYEL